jgi:hypothetical protein
VATINAHRICGPALIPGIAFLNGNCAMERMIVKMAPMRRHVPAIYAPLWGANPGAGHRRVAACALAHRAINWMNDFNGPVPVS